ncbi:MAG: head GIN domain-containing protein [Cyclobacteriaceae bacterium]
MKTLTTLSIALSLISTSVYAQSTEVRALADFTSVKVEGAGNIYLTAGDKSQVEIRLKNDSYALSDIITDVSGSRLWIDYKEKGTFKSAPKVDLWITYKSLEEISVSGAGKISTENTIKANRFVLDCEGAESAHLELDVNELIATMSGAGSFNLSGRADQQELEVSGAGSINAEDLVGQTVIAEVSGVGSLYVHGTERLKGTVSGVGKIRYKGDPKVQDLNNDGIGSIKRMD